MAVSQSIPDEFWNRLRGIVPTDRYAQVEESFSMPRSGSFRVNTLHAGHDEVLDALTEEGITPIPLAWYNHGFTVPPAQRELLGASPLTRDGRIWLQNPSSMLPPLVLAPEPGERVLDLAAAPGSKTLQLASLMRGEGELAAVEVVKPRFHRLRRNLNHNGAEFVRTYLQDGTRVWRYRPEYFDRVLVDAPCSTEGRFRVDEPQTFRYWSPSKIRSMARKQRALIESAVLCTRPGGTIVYSTCSFAPEENEAIVDFVLDRFDGFLAVEDIEPRPPAAAPGLDSWEETGFSEDVRQAVRILPDHQHEAFFVCRLLKTGSTGTHGRRKRR